jgi:hypothetical protein
MKIVKMHKGSRETFDDFLAQRLNEVEINNDEADKYIADMHLPISVTPVINNSFLFTNKNKLWLLLLLCIGSISIYVFVNNKHINEQETVAVKKEEKLGYKTISSIDEVNKAENKINKDKQITEGNNNTLSTNNEIVENERFSNTIVRTKIEKVNGNRFIKKQNGLLKKRGGVAEDYSYKTLVENKTISIVANAKITSTIVTPTIVSKPLIVDKKASHADSLYIIW